MHPEFNLFCSHLKHRDLHILADCIEKFRTFSLREYKLDPAHFLTAPSLSWDAALLYTNIVLEIPTDFGKVSYFLLVFDSKVYTYKPNSLW